MACRDCLHLGPSAYPGVRYVTPCLAGAENARAVGQHETFAPILYMMPCRTLDEAIALHNGVPQCVWTGSVR